jgi:hypothetical protein
VYNYGDTIIIVATPNEHYHFVQWSDGVKDNPRTIIVDQDISIEAEFEINTYKVTATCNSDFGVVTGSGTYNYGEHITLTATPNEHYHFVQWSDDVKDNPRTIIVDQDISIEAEFVPTTAVENVLDGQLSTPKKYLLNGQLIILRDDKKYTIMGQEVK